jgi:hypothetical protein
MKYAVQQKRRQDYLNFVQAYFVPVLRRNFLHTYTMQAPGLPYWSITARGHQA